MAAMPTESHLSANLRQAGGGGIAWVDMPLKGNFR